MFTISTIQLNSLTTFHRQGHLNSNLVHDFTVVLQSHAATVLELTHSALGSAGVLSWEFRPYFKNMNPNWLLGKFCVYIFYSLQYKKKIKWSRYRPGVAQRVGRGIALLFHDRGTRRGWVVSSTPRPSFTPGKEPGTHFTGGWVGPRAGLDGRKISSPPWFDPEPSSP